MIVPSAGIKDSQHQYAVFIKREIENLTNSGMKVVPLYLTSRFSPFVIHAFRKKVKAAVEEHRPDILHIQTGTAGLFLLGSGIKTPTVLTIGGSEILGYPGTSFFWRLRGKLASVVSHMVCKRVDQVISVSQNLVVALPGKLKRPAKVIPRAVNTDFFKPMDRKIARKYLQWDEEKYYVAFSDPRPHMKVKNRPLAEDVVRKTSKTLGKEVELVVIYQKTPDQVKWILNGANALLVTSLHEGSPNIVKEAMACNLPVISVPCGDVEQLLHGVNNSRVVSYDSKELVEVLSQVITRALPSNGLEILQKKCLSNESFVYHISTLYNEIIRVQ